MGASQWVRRDGELTLVSPEPEDDVNSRTVQLVRLLTELGPDVPEIARRLSQFKESVRYRYKEKILSKGFAVQAAVDHESLGLKRMVVVLEFPESYRNYAAAILTAMSEVSFVVSSRASALVQPGWTVRLVLDHFGLLLSWSGGLFIRKGNDEGKRGG